MLKPTPYKILQCLSAGATWGTGSSALFIPTLQYVMMMLCPAQKAGQQECTLNSERILSAVDLFGAVSGQGRASRSRRRHVTSYVSQFWVAQYVLERFERVACPKGY